MEFHEWTYEELERTLSLVQYMTPENVNIFLAAVNGQDHFGRGGLKIRLAQIEENPYYHSSP